MTVDGLKCPNCQSSRTGRSPCGVYCNDCGWCEPGLECLVCGRRDVAEKHRNPDGGSCNPSLEMLRKPGWGDSDSSPSARVEEESKTLGGVESYVLTLKAHGGTDSPEVGFSYDGGIEYFNFKPTPETRGIMEGLGALIFQHPYEFAKGLIDFAEARVRRLQEVAQRSQEQYREIAVAPKPKTLSAIRSLLLGLKNHLDEGGSWGKLPEGNRRPHMTAPELNSETLEKMLSDLEDDCG